VGARDEQRSRRDHGDDDQRRPHDLAAECAPDAGRSRKPDEQRVPGNVGELESAILVALALALTSGDTIDVVSLPALAMTSSAAA
jgi:hypothetical protein